MNKVENFFENTKTGQVIAAAAIMATGYGLMVMASIFG